MGELGRDLHHIHRHVLERAPVQGRFGGRKTQRQGAVLVGRQPVASQGRWVQDGT
jgi:hypothetical protein